VNSLSHSTHLENSAKDFFKVSNPEDMLAERVEKYTEWDGELDEIVHYTKKGVNGRDVLINVMLSDESGSNNNKDILFGENFKHFGVKVATNNGNEYCIVLEYASELGHGGSNQVNYDHTERQEKYGRGRYDHESERQSDASSFLQTPSNFIFKITINK